MTFDTFSSAIEWAQRHRNGLDDAELSRVKEQYRLVRADVQHDDGRRWTLFGSFLVVQGLLAAVLTTGIYWWIISALGAGSTVILGLAIWRNNIYLKDRSMLATVIEQLVGPTEPVLRFYDESARIPDARLAWQRSEGLLATTKKEFGLTFGKVITAWLIIRTTIYGTATAWFTLFLSSVVTPHPYREWIVFGVTLILVVVVTVDIYIELKARLLRINDIPAQVR